MKRHHGHSNSYKELIDWGCSELCSIVIMVLEEVAESSTSEATGRDGYTGSGLSIRNFQAHSL